MLSAAAAAASATAGVAGNGSNSSSSRVTTLEVQRTQWVEGDHGNVEGGGWIEEGVTEPRAADQPETNENLEVEHGHEEGLTRRGGGGGGGQKSARRRSSVSAASSVPPSAPRLAWGNAMRELTSSVNKVVSI